MASKSKSPKLRPRAVRRAEARRQAKVAPKAAGPPWLPIAATLTVVAAAIVLFVVFRQAPSSSVPTSAGAAATAQVLASITALPPDQLAQVGIGSATNSLKAVPDPPLTAAGRPEVLYLGAEYCPYCAAERWSLIIALSRFGTFTGLETTTSSSTDIFPDTPTFTFSKATYQSQYLTLVTVEEEDRNGKTLQTPDAGEQSLAAKYASGGIPFVDFGNRLAFSGATYSPQLLQDLTWQQVADDLQQPTSPQAKAILGSANLITAAICASTSQQPATVCSDPAVQSIERTFPAKP